MSRRWLSVVAVLLVVGGCEGVDAPTYERWAPGKFNRVVAPLEAAYCEVEVEGIGLVDTETDYLPHVITCENGGANLEALKAQAIAARSVAYYNMETQGSICDGQGCQVYSCGAQPAALAYEAVELTSGQYLHYSEVLTYGFYVAGDSEVMPSECVGSLDAATEHWVTYNEGKAGTEVQQTELGFVHDPMDSGYGQNRGCMSQWGARCLENDNGYDALAILRFFYGADINVQQAPGACIEPLPGDGDGGGDGDGDAGTDTGALETGSTDEGGTGAEGPLPDDFGGDSDASGCGCRARGGVAPWMWAALLVFGLRRRRGRA